MDFIGAILSLGKLGGDFALGDAQARHVRAAIDRQGIVQGTLQGNSSTNFNSLIVLAAGIAVSFAVGYVLVKAFGG